MRRDPTVFPIGTQKFVIGHRVSVRIPNRPLLKKKYFKKQQNKKTKKNDGRDAPSLTAAAESYISGIRTAGIFQPT